ncbi:MAG: hypothetical protein IJS61_03490 [Firmicutes bacterium]|nr:hypothetical protein [Bacillota bacterium]
MKLNIIEEHNTVYGKILIVENNQNYLVGDVVETKKGKKYKIKKILMPTNPNDIGKVSIVV